MPARKTPARAAPPRPPWNLARFDLLSLRLALACAQHASLTLAARECHLALAAASRRVRELEATLGSALFVRSAKGLALTPAGQLFAKHAAALLGHMDRLAVALSDLDQGVVRHVRLVASTAAINPHLPPLLAQWATESPAVRIDLDEAVTGEVIAALHDRRAEVGLFVEGPDVRGLSTRLFREDELVVLTPPRHHLARGARGRAPVHFADLLGEDWIGLNAGAAVLLQQQQVAAAAGRPLRLRVQVRSFDAACHMVAAGLGLALLPRESVQTMAAGLQLGLRPLHDAWARRRLLLAVLQGQNDAAVQSVADFLATPLATPIAPADATAAAVSTVRSSPNAKTRSRKAQ